MDEADESLGIDEEEKESKTEEEKESKPEEEKESKTDDSHLQIILLSFLRQLYCCSVAILLPVYGIAIDHSLYESHRTEDYVLPYTVGEILGVLSGGIFMTFFGRKLALILTHLLYLCYLSISFYFHLGGRFLNPLLVGLTFSFGTMVFLLYVAEICSVTFRAFFMGSYFTSLHLANYCMLFMQHPKVKSYSIALGMAVVSSIVSVLVPETPYYMALIGKLQNAEEIFSWIRGSSADPAEYNLMLSQVERGQEFTEFSLHTFVACMIMGILLRMCNASGCELLQEVYYHMKSLGDRDYTNRLYLKVFVLSWFGHVMDKAIGSFTFSCISFVIPRKRIYGTGFLLTLLLIIPLALASSAYDMIVKLFYPCSVIMAVGRHPLALILPLEILPTNMRTVGLMAVFVYDRMIILLLHVASTAEGTGWRLKKLGRTWILFSYSVSLIGVPFLLIFMPETKDKSIFELEEVTIRLTDILPSRKTALQDEEESAPE